MKRVMQFLALMGMLVGCAENLERPEVGVEWELVGRYTWRTPVPNGWLVSCNGNAVAFVPDPDHDWQITP